MDECRNRTVFTVARGLALRPGNVMHDADERVLPGSVEEKQRLIGIVAADARQDATQFLEVNKISKWHLARLLL
jgi:hypothetical protein